MEVYGEDVIWTEGPTINAYWSVVITGSPAVLAIEIWVLPKSEFPDVIDKIL